MNAVTSFALTPADALLVSVDTALALSLDDQANWQATAVQGWADAFGQKPSFELQYNLIREEGLELAQAGMAMQESLTAETVAHWLKESADFNFVLAGLPTVAAPTGIEEQFKAMFALKHVEQMTHMVIAAEIATVRDNGWNHEVVKATAIEAFHRVLASNMTKLDDNGQPIFNEDGKIVKGPNYKAPDLTDLAERIIASTGTGSVIH